MSDGISRRWWSDDGKVCALIRFLDKRDGLTGTEAVRIFEEPWSWDTEWQEYLDSECLKPQEIIETIRKDEMVGHRTPSIFNDVYTDRELLRIFGEFQSIEEVRTAARKTHRDHLRSMLSNS